MTKRDIRSELDRYIDLHHDSRSPVAVTGLILTGDIRVPVPVSARFLGNDTEIITVEDGNTSTIVSRLQIVAITIRRGRTLRPAPTDDEGTRLRSELPGARLSGF